MSGQATAPWSVLRLLEWTREYLEARGIEKGRREAEDLLGQVLDLDRLKLYLSFEYEPSPSELALFRERVARRAKREPRQYIEGQVEFAGLKIKVDRRALIPRPETEAMLGLALKEFHGHGRLRVIDAGTGSGCLALAMAAQGHEVLACDLSPEALSLAQENAEALGLAPKIRFKQGDAAKLADENGLGSFDLVLGNPPYIARADMASLQPEVRDYEPALALEGGESGLDCIRAWQSLGALLKPGGLLIFECGLGQAGLLAREWSGLSTWKEARSAFDPFGKERYLLALKR